jgi:YfiH family protein
MELEKLILNNSASGIVVVQTTRGKVNSRNAYSQYNLCDYTGDDALRVLEARLEFCSLMGVDLDHLVMPRQSHTTRVLTIGEDYFDAGIEDQEAMLEDVDALVTDLPGLCIGVNTADCVPIALADSTAGVIAVAHAGWRGTVGKIALCTVQAMVRLGAKPQRIAATMGASICADCFEVGDEVPQAFEQAGFDMQLIMHRNAATGKAHINLQEANRQVLIDAGLNSGNINMPTACSRCRHQRYFSARRLGINSGRTFTAILRRDA